MLCWAAFIAILGCMWPTGWTPLVGHFSISNLTWNEEALPKVQLLRMCQNEVQLFVIKMLLRYLNYKEMNFTKIVCPNPRSLNFTHENHKLNINPTTLGCWKEIIYAYSNSLLPTKKS